MSEILLALQEELRQKSLASVKEDVFTQPIPYSVWNITHTRNDHPSVTIYSGTDEIIGLVTYTSASTLTITFSEAVSGVAYLR